MSLRHLGCRSVDCNADSSLQKSSTNATRLDQALLRGLLEVESCGTGAGRRKMHRSARHIDVVADDCEPAFGFLAAGLGELWIRAVHKRRSPPALLRMELCRQSSPFGGRPISGRE